MPAPRADVPREGGVTRAHRSPGGCPRGASEPPFAYLVTCEHGGNVIPPAYRALFRAHRDLLASHRGYDRGARSMAVTLARVLGAALIVATTSRLLVELNRSPGREFRQSPIMRLAPAALRAEVTRGHYVPYRRDVEAFVRMAVERGKRVLHVSSHSFTPTFDATMRRADAGLLYDPSRSFERELCRRWQAAVAASRPRFVVRRNYPYRGVSDGFTSYLRRRFPAGAYAGIELEVNQKHARGNAFPAALRTAIAEALCEALASPL